MPVKKIRLILLWPGAMFFGILGILFLYLADLRDLKKYRVKQGQESNDKQTCG